MNINKAFVIALVTGFLIGAATIGCGSSATSAADNDSAYATTASVTALQTQVTALQAALCADDARLAGLRISSVTSSSGTNTLCATAARDAHTRATTPACSTPPTIISRGQGATATVQTVVTCAGYVYTEDLVSGTPQPADFTVFYDGAGCTGNAYTAQGPVPLPTLTHGIGFRLDPNNLGAADTSTYYMVQAGVAPVSTIFLSSVSATSPCLNISPLPFAEAFKVVANDPNVSIMPNAPAGPQIPGA